MTIERFINLGCSFAYGNQASSIGVLSGQHKNAVTYLSEWLGKTEINLARPGNSNEGILDNFLDWISTSSQEERDSSIVFIGWTSGIRFGFVSDLEQVSNKARSAKGKSDIAAIAFTLGPPNPYRFKIDKWNHRWRDQHINVQETAILSLYRNIIAVQSAAHKFNIKVVHYHSIDPRWLTQDGLTYEVNSHIRTIVDESKFYGFDQLSLQELANSDKAKYYVASDDSHPNHLCYQTWSNDMLDWMKQNGFWGWL